MADAAGIGWATLSQIEHGQPISLLIFVRRLRTLEQLTLLDTLGDQGRNQSFGAVTSAPSLTG